MRRIHFKKRTEWLSVLIPLYGPSDALSVRVSFDICHLRCLHIRPSVSLHSEWVPHAAMSKIGSVSIKHCKSITCTAYRGVVDGSRPVGGIKHLDTDPIQEKRRRTKWPSRSILVDGSGDNLSVAVSVDRGRVLHLGHHKTGSCPFPCRN